MTGRHRSDDQHDLPSFTGDVPSDIALAGNVVRRRFYTIFARGATGFVLASVLVIAWTAVLAPASELVSPDHPTATTIALSAVGVCCGIASLVRPVPGQVRYVLGAAPAAGLVVAAGTASSSYDPALDYVPGVLGLAALVTGGAYVITGGLQFWDHSKRRLAALTAPRAPSDPRAK